MKQIPKRVLAIGLSAALLVPGGALAAAGGDPCLLYTSPSPRD